MMPWFLCPTARTNSAVVWKLCAKRHMNVTAKVPSYSSGSVKGSNLALFLISRNGHGGFRSVFQTPFHSRRVLHKVPLRTSVCKVCCGWQCYVMSVSDPKNLERHENCLENERKKSLMALNP